MENEVKVVLKAVDKASGEINKVTTAGSKLSSGFQSLTGMSLGAAGAIGIATIALKKAVEYSKMAIDAASDLAETESKVGVVFEDQAEAMMGWAQTAAEAMGMSSNAALTAAGTYGNLFRAMGITSEKSSEMSKSLVQLASDLASFNNMDPTMVLDKLRAGLSGEVEPLRTLGVNLNQAAIEQEALNIGVWDGVGALSAAQKAQASYSLILKQTSLAQGDFERTGEGLANQQRINQALAEDLKASIGENLLPVKLKWLNMMNDITKAAYDLTEAKNREKRIIEDESSMIDEQSTRFEKLMEHYSSIGIYAGEAYDLTMNNLRASDTYTASLIAQAKAFYLLHPEIEMTAEQMEYLGMSTRGIGDDFGTLTEDLSGVTGLFKEMTSEMLFAAAAEGLNADQALLLAVNMGLVDHGTKVALESVANIKKDFAETKDIETFNEEIMKVDRNLRGLPSAKSFTYTLYGNITGSFRDALDAAGFSSPIQKPGDSGAGLGEATGGLAGGWKTVGEMGPELVKLPAGSQVFSNTQSKQMTGGGLDYDRLAKAVGREVVRGLITSGYMK